MRAESPVAKGVSGVASRIKEAIGAEETDEDLEGVKSSGPAGEEEVRADEDDVAARDVAKSTDEATGQTLQAANERSSTR